MLLFEFNFFFFVIKLFYYVKVYYDSFYDIML